MYDEKIDTKVLIGEVSKLKEVKEKMNSIYNELQKDNNELKEFWDTNASEQLFKEYDVFDKEFKQNINDLQNDIIYLENFIQSYELYEQKANKEIDEKIAV